MTDPSPRSPLDTDRFAEACAYAVRAHGSQLRKGTDVPYASHVLAVAALVLEHGGTTDQAIAGLLHDVAEDRGGAERLHDVELRFGAEVARMVAALSDAVPAPGSPKGPWLDRKIAHLAHLEDRVAARDPAVLVHACDALHNLRSIVEDLDDPAVGRTVFARFNASAPRVAWRYREVGRRLTRADGDLIPSRLVRTYTALGRRLTGATRWWALRPSARSLGGTRAPGAPTSTTHGGPR